MNKEVLDSVSTIAKFQWDDVYKNSAPECYITEAGVCLALPEIVDSFTMADAMADEFRDMGLDAEILESSRRYYIQIPSQSLNADGCGILLNEAESARNAFNEQYRTNIEITPLGLMPFAEGEENPERTVLYKGLEGFCAVIELNELQLQVLDASQFADRKGAYADADSEDPLSTYSLQEWRQRVPDRQLYFTDAFQINRGTSPISAVYSEFCRTSAYGLKVGNGKRVPGFERHEKIFNRVLDSMVFTRKPDGTYNAYILPQQHIVEKEDGFYTAGGDKIEHAISGIMSLKEGEAISLNGAARENEERPRMGMGLRDNETGTGKQLVIIIVQGGYLGCEGRNIPHSGLVEMMKDNGCENVLTLDGGGTASMVFQGRTQNSSYLVTHPGDEEGYRAAPGCTIIR